MSYRDNIADLVLTLSTLVEQKGALTKMLARSERALHESEKAWKGVIEKH
jgi:hypothetical protein